MSKDHKLSVRRQCVLLTLVRSNLYYDPKGESAESLRFMKIIDKQFLGDAVVLVASNGAAYGTARPQVWAAPCTAVDAPYAIGANQSGAQHQ